MDLIIHPEVKRLKDKLSDLIFTYDELIYHICPNIEHEYIIKFGLLEYELYQCDFELNKVKRKFQLMQIQINNEEELNMKLINEKLEKEFDEYQKSLKNQMNDLQKALDRSNNQHLSDEDSKKLKKIYRECVLKLHPDLNNLSEDYQKLFVQINNAFKEGDLKTLEILSNLVINVDIEDDDEISGLKESIEIMENKITEVKEKYPYNKLGLLKDNKSIEEYKKRLKDLIEHYSKEKLRFEEKISELL